MENYTKERGLAFIFQQNKLSQMYRVIWVLFYPQIAAEKSRNLPQFTQINTGNKTAYKLGYKSI